MFGLGLTAEIVIIGLVIVVITVVFMIINW